MKKNDKVSALVIGGAGSVGSLFCQLLTNAGVSTMVLDLHIPDHNKSISGVEYIESDATKIDAKIISDKTFILLTVPEAQALKAIRLIVPALNKHQCLIDTTSTKTRIAKLILEQDPICEYVSINPMFGPSLGFKNQNVSWINIKPGPNSDYFMGLLNHAGSNLVMLSADEHDKHTAAIQAATHAAILAFGTTLLSMDYNPLTSKAIWTPPHKIMLALLVRILDIKPEVFLEIQKDNPYASVTRDHMINNLKHISDVVCSGSPSEVEKIFHNLLEFLEEEKLSLKNMCQSIFAHIARDFK